MKIWIALLWIWCSQALAQSPTWFTVEVVVFAQESPAAVASEVWPLEPPAPSLEGAIELTGPGEPTGEPSTAAGSRPGARAFRVLGRKSRQLAGVVRRLARSGRYQPLLHVAWRQPGFSRSRAPAVHLDSNALGSPIARRRGRDEEARARAPRVDGTLRVYRARYLHVDADLVYRPRSMLASPAAATTPAEITGETAPAGASEPTAFRLHQSRRMRSGELHYLDHPLFGVLVRITRYQAPAVPGGPAPAVAAPATHPSPTPGRAKTIPLPPRRRPGSGN